MNCCRCGGVGSERHIGALHDSDVALCSTCFREWKTLNEKIRLEFCDALSAAQATFLRTAVIEEVPTEIEDEDVGIEEVGWEELAKQIRVSPSAAKTIITVPIDDSTDFELFEKN